MMQNLKNDAHCMVVTSHGGKWAIYPLMPVGDNMVREEIEEIAENTELEM